MWSNFLIPQIKIVGMYMKLHTQLENLKKIKLGNLDWKTPWLLDTFTKTHLQIKDWTMFCLLSEHMNSNQLSP